MTSSCDVLIVGGGVIGLTTAYYLATRTGASVRVLDRGPLGREASWAGAGIIPPNGSAAPDSATPFDCLRAVSTALLPGLTAELREATGIDPGYRVTGGVEFPAHELIDTDAWTREGVEWSQVRDDELQRIEPDVAHKLGPAYYLPGMAQIRNPRHLQALIAALEAKAVRLQPYC